MPPPDPQWLEVINGLFKFVGAPAAIALGILWAVRKWILPKANGRTTQEITALTDGLAGKFRDMTQATAREFMSMVQEQDLSRTQHFDQLRRDLTTTIEKQAQLSRDDLRNALGTLLLEQELGRLRAEDK